MIINLWIFFPSLFLGVTSIYYRGFRDGHLQGWRDNEDHTGIVKYDLTK